MHPKKRLELIIETMAQKKAVRILDDSGVKGHTTFMALSGKSEETEWSRVGDISSSQHMVMIVAIGDQAIIATACAKLHDLLSEHIGVLSISDVDVLRPERF